MAFQIPNAIAAGGTQADDVQAQIDSVDIAILIAADVGDGVVSGCAVTTAGTDLNLSVAAGIIMASGVRAAVAAGTVTVTAAHATLVRLDLVVVNNAGTKSVVAGAAAAIPVFPAIPANSVVLAAVFVPPTDTAIASNQLVDKRVMLSPNKSYATRLYAAATLR